MLAHTRSRIIYSHYKHHANGGARNAVLPCSSPLLCLPLAFDFSPLPLSPQYYFSLHFTQKTEVVSTLSFSQQCHPFTTHLPTCQQRPPWPTGAHSRTQLAQRTQLAHSPNSDPITQSTSTYRTSNHLYISSSSSWPPTPLPQTSKPYNTNTTYPDTKLYP